MKNDLFYRGTALNRESVKPENRTVPVVFSSEAPVMRWFGSEVLLHGKKNVDLSRLKSVGAVLMNHDARTIVGPISGVKLDIDTREGRATVGFDDDEDGNKAMGKVNSGSLRGVSVGYRVQKFREIMRDEEWTDEDSGRTFKGPAMIATRWQPIEISLTPVPADTASQVGREMSRSLDGIEIEQTQTRNTEENEMNKEEIQAMIDESLRGLAIPKAEDIAAAVRESLAEERAPKMQVDQAKAKDLLGRAGAISEAFKSRMSDMIFDGKTEIELERAISDEAMKDPDAKDKKGGGDDLQDGRQDDFEKIDGEEFAAGLRSLSDPGL